MEPVSDHKGFNLPEGYFEQFPDGIAKRIGLSKVTGAEAARGFHTPEGYFETLGERIEERLTKKEVPVRKLRPVQLIWIPAVAAAVLLLLLWSPSTPATTLQFEDINAEALQAYLQTEEFDVTPGELAENLPLIDIAMQDVLDRAPEARQIEAYLEDHIESDEELYLDPNE
jgi:hypothetical protein